MDLLYGTMRTFYKVVNLIEKAYSSTIKYLCGYYIERPSTGTTHILHYYHKSTPYKILLRSNRVRSRVNGIYDESDREVSEIVKPYMGPNLDFHQMEISPRDIGFAKLTFFMLNGQKYAFDEYQHIVFSNQYVQVEDLLA